MLYHLTLFHFSCLTYRFLTDGFGTDFPSFVQFSRLVTELFWSFSDLMHISLCFLSRKQGSVKCLTNKKLMATVKTVLVKGRSNRSGKFPLVVQVLHKRRKKVVYTGFSIPDTLFDPVKGRVIDGGENTPESIRRIPGIRNRGRVQDLRRVNPRSRFLFLFFTENPRAS